MTTEHPVYVDATMMYRWRDLAPVGIVRLERLIARHLRFGCDLPTRYVMWDAGYRHADEHEIEILDAIARPAPSLTRSANPGVIPPAQGPGTAPRRSVAATVRRTALRAAGRLPDELRPFAERAAWSVATLAVESARHVKRRRRGAPRPGRSGVQHAIDFGAGDDLVVLGLGWEYIDHEAMYVLARDRGVRIHMPAFDLIPIVMPQMNWGQSHLVHRYYAEMAHYADTITSISQATTDALRAFYAAEQLPTPLLTTNPLPGLERLPPAEHEAVGEARRRHRLEGETYVLTVSTVEIRKNHLLLAKIWAECADAGIELPRLVIVGRIGWDVTELLRWVDHAPQLADTVTILSDVGDGELVEMYRDALFTVFPSRIEGWGLPITEALGYGKVCVHSDDPGQIEAAQGLMPALHPDDFMSWKAEIVRLAHDHAYRAGLERTIAERYVDRTPDEYVADFERVLRGRRGPAA